MTTNIRHEISRAADELGAVCYARQVAAAKHVRRVNGVPNVRYVPPAIHEMLVQALREDWGNDRAMALLHTRDYEIMRYGDGNVGMG